MSIVEKRICSQHFSYLHPNFYNNPYALRCELGQGDDPGEYMETALRRALGIYDILLPAGADAICFNYWEDLCDSGPAEQGCCEETMEEVIARSLDIVAGNVRFLLENQFRYRHVTVSNLPTYDEPSYAPSHRNRVVCYSDGKGFDYRKLIEKELSWQEGHEVSFVSFANECILSVYDDRGCDVVFMTREKLREFYHKLEPYFLDYDREEMERRFRG